ncbi:MAG: DUF4831 family protein [Bacteroidales bacterium]|nr:DUF4831 family protein [Bacteroidales bacterium]
MRKMFIAALAGLACTGLPAQEINSYVPGEGEGVAFFLPKTALEVRVVATKVTYQPGELCQYANRYLRINNVKAEPETHWEIKCVEVGSVGVPDSTKAYIVKLKDREVLSKVDLTEDGILRAINTTGQDLLDQPAYKLEKPAARVNPRDYLTEEILMAGSTAKMAELTAKDIYNIRESRNLILRGQADTMPKDGASLQLVIDNLNRQEKAMMELFTGSTDREDQVFTFRIAPEDKLVDKVVARFSTRLGVLPEDDLAGAPLYINVSSVAPLPVLPEEPSKKKRPDGVQYNLPGKGKVKVVYEGKKLYEGELPVTQFGTTETLVTKLFDARVNTRVVFHPSTGAVLKIDKD